MKTSKEEYVERLEGYLSWLEKSGVYEYISIEDLSAEEISELEQDSKRAEETDEPPFYWTEHGTCEDDNVSSGVLLMGDISQLDQVASGCGCWQTRGFYRGAENYLDDYIRVAMYRICESCDPDESKYEAGEQGDSDCSICYGDISYTEYFEETVRLAEVTDENTGDKRLEWIQPDTESL